MIEIEVADRQQFVEVPGDRLREAVTQVLREEGVEEAEVSVAVVDDSVIHELNRRYLSHDWPTDVLSFSLGEGPGEVSGEVIVNAQRAAAVAPHYHWTPGDELLLYVVHGALHLCGYEDQGEEERSRMRSRERAILKRWGLRPEYEGRTGNGSEV